MREIITTKVEYLSEGDHLSINGVFEFIDDIEYAVNGDMTISFDDGGFVTYKQGTDVRALCWI
jgi:hypothetical protein